MPCGRLTDRFGSRIVSTGVLLALGGTVLVMSHTSGLLMLSLMVTLSRGLGQSAVVSLSLVGKWFARKLNSAMGIYSVLVAIGFIAAFPGVGHAVLRHGWRPAWSGVGLVLVLVLAPLAWIIVRKNPEEEGLTIDGNTGQEEGRLTDLTLSQAPCLLDVCTLEFRVRARVFRYLPVQPINP